MKKIFSFLNKESSQNLIASLLAILVGIVFGFLVLLMTKPENSVAGIILILKGGFHHGIRGLGNVIFRAVPIILTGLSVGFAFKTGLFNIGVTGQFTVGAFAAIYVGVNFTGINPLYGWILGLMAAALAGMIWGLIVGLLKAYRNVNEVIASIMMNYIGMYFVNYLIVNTAFDDVHARTLKPVSAFLPKGGLNTLFPRSSIDIGIIIAIVIAIVIYIVLEKTSLGYELKAVGYNRYAGRYAGINEKRSIIISMATAGALAGIGGGLMYLADVGKYMSTINVLLAEGFTGISVALLAQNNPIAIIFSGLFISHLTYGGSNLQIYGMEPEIIQVITAAIIYISALSLILRNMLSRISLKYGEKGDETV